MSHVNAVLVNHPGPLPISFEYIPVSDEAEAIWFSGSIRAGDIATVKIGFELRVDGVKVGESLITAGDDQNPHHATVATMVNYDIPYVFDPKTGQAKPVTIELALLSDSFSETGDFYNVAIIT